MQISVSNFKGIGELPFFSLKKINVLAGANSGGKSSLIHLLLLIKQSIEARSTNTPLKLNKPYISLGRFENIISKQSNKKELSFGLYLLPNELTPRLRSMLPSKGRLGNKNLSLDGFRGIKIKVSFRKPTEKIVVSAFELTIDAVTSFYLNLTRSANGKSYELTTNGFEFFFLMHGSEFKDDFQGKHITAKCSVSFISFLPDYIELTDEKFSGVDNNFIFNNQLRISINKFFSKISYLGPLRDEPREFYYQDDDFVDSIGTKGENAAFILAKHAEDIIKYRRLSEDGKFTSEVSGNLIQAVNYWLCDVFGLAKSITVKRAKANRNMYTIELKNNFGNMIPITHVGFGVSQVFPILVEGLRQYSGNQLIILEQPEIHLHPKVQAALFDFVNSSNGNISFLIETHSDHFINRLRRRVAECVNEAVISDINLTFVNRDFNNVSYEELAINEVGSFDYWPEGFFDQYDEDLRAIVLAQSLKRKNNKIK